jgi:hypothetical protein
VGQAGGGVLAAGKKDKSAGVHTCNGRARATHQTGDQMFSVFLIVLGS